MTSIDSPYARVAEWLRWHDSASAETLAVHWGITESEAKRILVGASALGLVWSAPDSTVWHASAK